MIRNFLLTLTLAFMLGTSTSSQETYDPAVSRALLESAVKSGNPARGAVIYAAPTSACLSCHKVGKHGGDVGPDLSQVGAKQKHDYIVESVLWPKKEVKDEYKAIAVLTGDGQVLRGYKVKESEQKLQLRDSASGKEIAIDQDDIEAVQNVGTLMPDGLLATLSDQDKRDLVAFLLELGQHQHIGAEAIESLLSHAHGHHPVSFEMPRAPLHPEIWPSWQADVKPRSRL